MDEKYALIALSRVKGLGRLAKRRIVEVYPDVTRLFRGQAFDSATPAGISSRFNDWKGIEKDLKLLNEIGADIVTIKDDEYPELLKQIPDAPIALYRKGPLQPTTRTLAIVGSRKASPEGMNLAEKIGETLSSTGITIASGFARGVDTAAHTGALRGEGGTIAVLGCGIDTCYPPENTRLFHKIGDKGLILTEYGPGEQPVPHHFPERNRIIAGLSRGTLVAEASSRSGSLITARLALEYGREVMAIPGSVFQQGHTGSNRLIKEGARLIDGIEDILGTCFPGVSPVRGATPGLDNNEKKVYSLIGFEKVHADEVIERSGMDTQEVMATLTRLAMKNVVTETPGGFFIRR